MKQGHVIKHFLAWSEGRAGREERLRIESHLKDCRRCRMYFDGMAELFKRLDPAFLPHLEADEYLPARIRAMAKDSSKAGIRRVRFAWSSFSLAGIVMIAAVVIGIFVGRGISTTSSLYDSYDEETIVSAYYDAVSQSGLSEDWEYVLASNESDSQRQQ